MDNEQILEEVHSTFNHAKATIALYKQAIKKYCNFHGMSLEELIKEAEKEEDNGGQVEKKNTKKKVN